MRRGERVEREVQSVTHCEQSIEIMHYLQTSLDSFSRVPTPSHHCHCGVTHFLLFVSSSFLAPEYLPFFRWCCYIFSFYFTYFYLAVWLFLEGKVCPVSLCCQNQKVTVLPIYFKVMSHKFLKSTPYWEWVRCVCVF